MRAPRGGGWSGRPCGHVGGSLEGGARRTGEECWTEAGCIGSGAARGQGWGPQGRTARISAGPSAGSGRRGRRGAASATFPPRVTFCFGAGDSPASSLAPPPLFRVRAFSGPGNPASWPRVAREGRRVLELGPSGDWTLPGGRRTHGQAVGAPCEALGGAEGDGASGPFPPNPGKTAIAEVGRACRPFLEERAAELDAHSPRALRSRAPALRCVALLASKVQLPGPWGSRAPSASGTRLVTRLGLVQGSSPPRPGASASSTLGTCIRRHYLFLETVAISFSLQGRKNYKVTNSWKARLAFPPGSMHAPVSRGACGTKYNLRSSRRGDDVPG